LVVGVAVQSATATKPGYRVHIDGTAQILPTTQLRLTVSYGCPASVGLAFIYATVVQDPQDATTTVYQGAPCTGKVEMLSFPVDANFVPWVAGRAMVAASVFAAGATQDVEYRSIRIVA